MSGTFSLVTLGGKLSFPGQRIPKQSLGKRKKSCFNNRIPSNSPLTKGRIISKQRRHNPHTPQPLVYARGILFNFLTFRPFDISTLFHQHHPLRCREITSRQSVKVNSAGHLTARIIPPVPGGDVVPSLLRLVHQRPHLLPQHVENL